MNTTAPKTLLITAQTVPSELSAAGQWAYGQGSSDTEAIDQDHFVLVACADGFRRLAK